MQRKVNSKLFLEDQNSEEEEEEEHQSELNLKTPLPLFLPSRTLGSSLR